MDFHAIPDAEQNMGKDPIRMQLPFPRTTMAMSLRSSGKAPPPRPSERPRCAGAHSEVFPAPFSLTTSGPLARIPFPYTASGGPLLPHSIQSMGRIHPSIVSGNGILAFAAAFPPRAPSGNLIFPQAKLRPSVHTPYRPSWLCGTGGRVRAAEKNEC